MNTPMNPTDKEALLGRTAPSRQKQAREYLQGRVPGVMEHYAPDGRTDADQGWVESDDTVQRLARWREESPY